MSLVPFDEPPSAVVVDRPWGVEYRPYDRRAEHERLWLEAERNTQRLLAAEGVRPYRDRPVNSPRLVALLILLLPALAGGMAIATFYPWLAPLLIVFVLLASVVGLAALLSAG